MTSLFSPSAREAVEREYAATPLWRLAGSVCNRCLPWCRTFMLHPAELLYQAFYLIDTLRAAGEEEARRWVEECGADVERHLRDRLPGLPDAECGATAAVILLTAAWWLEEADGAGDRCGWRWAVRSLASQAAACQGGGAVCRDFTGCENLYRRQGRGFMTDYMRQEGMLSQDIERLLAPGMRASGKKAKPPVPYTLPYKCRDQATRRKRILIVMQLMQAWGWIEEPQYAEDFEHLFDGEPRSCNIRWTGQSLAILTELMSRLLKQPYMGRVTGLSATSIVKGQFGKGRSSNTERLDAEAQERISIIVRILDYNKPLPWRSCDGGCDGEDISALALNAVLAGELHATRDLSPRCG